MKKKILSFFLLITILTSYLPVIPITKAKVETREWEFNYTGTEQTFTAPYKGIYKIEVYGAQRRQLW